MTLLFAASLREELAILAVPVAASAVIWAWIYARWQRGEPVIPLARRRPVPWQGRDVLFIFLAGMLFPMIMAAVVRGWRGSDAAQPAADQEPKLVHPAELLLRSGDPAAIVIAVTMAVIVAPLIEEFLFRVLLQGWMEAVWSRQRRKYPELRAAPSSCLPIVLPAVLFALMHLRASKTPLAPQYLVGSFLGQMAADLLTLALAFVFLRLVVGATAADLGWKAKKLPSDARLGLWALLAATPPVLVLQVSLIKLVNLTNIDYAPDPIPLFFLALVFGVLYQRTHRLAPSLVLHMAFNATSVVLFFAGR